MAGDGLSVPRNPGAWLMATAQHRAVDLLRPALCEDALRLGRIVAELVPQEPEVHALVAIKLGRVDEARLEFERAASLTRNARERELLLGRAAACTRATPSEVSPPA